jgi:uncharacterized delta-60 repeat protein
MSTPADLILQPDGKIVLAGTVGIDTLIRIALVRYNPDGTYDTSFDGDGAVKTTVLGMCRAAAAVVQPDGKIVITGFAIQPSNSTYHIVLARYNTDGSLDTSFDGDGVVTIPISGQGSGTAVAVQADGKILMGGSSGSPNRFTLARFNTDGSADPTFGGGIVNTQLSTSSGISSIALMPDGSIIAAGSANGSNSDFAVARYNPDGLLDTTFDSDGIVITPVGTGNDFLAGIAIQADGKLVAAGHAFNGTRNDMALVRYNTDGSLDSSYGAGGKAVIALFSDTTISSLSLDAAGKAVVVGTSGASMLAARITAEPAPLVDVGGRITSTNGQGIGNAQIVLRDVNNNRRYALTNAFGYYIFSGVSSNESYIVSVSSKRYRFQPSSQSIILVGSLANVDFIGNPGSESRSAGKPAIKTTRMLSDTGQDRER